MVVKAWSDFRIFYTDHFEVPLPEGHRFPMEKYRLVKHALISRGILEASQLLPAPLAKQQDLLRAHTKTYVEGLFSHSLPTKETRPIGLPLGEALLQRSLASVGGFLKACDYALQDGFSAVLAGGTHHAHADRGEGFCVFNDFAVASLKLLQEGRVKKILIIDLDVHQGNGNSSILGERDDVFILSLHGEKNYPFRKVPSHLDVALPEGTQDEEYLDALKKALNQIEEITFDLIMYQAGVDVLMEDRFGTFHLTHAGVRRRDQIVFELAKGRSTPLVMALGGGYGDPLSSSIEAYVGTYEMARKVYSF